MQTIATNSFLCQYWDAIACNPDNWTYEPSTYGVSGVEMIGDIHMKLWKDLSHWKNPGRANGVDLAKVEELKEDIQDSGIRLDAPVIYYDVDTNETINGDHRFTVSSILDIPGWMCQAVRFESVASKIRFATTSNIKKKDVYNPISAADVNAAVRELISVGAIVTDDQIRAETRFLGKGAISESAIREISSKIIIERIFSGKPDGAERLQSWNDDRLPVFFDNATDKWVDDYWNNESEYTMYVNMANFASRWGSIISLASQAVISNKPIHFMFSIKLMQNESIDTSRSKVFTDKLAQLEQKLCSLFGLDVNRHKSMLPWHHPECEHRFLPQDNQKEDFTKLIKI